MGQASRDLPVGTWYDFNTDVKYEGGKHYDIEMSLDQIPLFVKERTILPCSEGSVFACRLVDGKIIAANDRTPSFPYNNWNISVFQQRT